MNAAEEDWQIIRFCRQYLQLEHVLDYPAGEVLREEATQALLYKKLFADKATPPRYRLKVLRHLVTHIETSVEDWDLHGISDDLMSALSDVLAEPVLSDLEAAQKKCRVVYHQSLLPQTSDADASITLLESRSVISASGTTGLRTWEASLHLGQYLCTSPSLITNKRVLELGAGTGYLAILCAKYLDAAHVIASDGSDDVINNIPDNVFLNKLQDSDKIKPMEVRWGHALVGTEEQAWNGGQKVDVVLGADITYDASVIPSLVVTLEELVALFPGVVVLIAATERNHETFQSFLDVCETQGFVVTHEEFPVPPRSEQMGPFYNDQTPIHICQLRYVGKGGS
ncbi:putative methyltransferase-domain-containing protein [Apodospora peruviana]|uniref:Methyltransferase-domain-containing protein n=1 Tax=Apodospora peruviana TaxID=516989 RepID=A0AAE0IKU1_9PEZI|nr:putative methyltransferase-domain-containing protein [Apodospora peruviana]